jgi:hypothetical protein
LAKRWKFVANNISGDEAMGVNFPDNGWVMELKGLLVELRFLKSL